MTYTIHQEPGVPIILVTVAPGSNVLMDQVEAVPQIMSVLDAQPEPVYMLVDITGVSIRLDQVSRGANVTARGERSLLHHPQLRESIFVTAAPMVRLALQVLSGVAFKHVRLSVFDTRTEALAYCHAASQTSAGGGVA